MTMDELLGLPVTFGIEVAGRAWDMGRTKSYDLARRGAFPCPVLRVGKSYRVTRADLFRALGIATDHAGRPADADLSGAPA
jgi:hypothetical protein